MSSQNPKENKGNFSVDDKNVINDVLKHINARKKPASSNTPASTGGSSANVPLTETSKHSVPKENVEPKPAQQHLTSENTSRLTHPTPLTPSQASNAAADPTTSWDASPSWGSTVDINTPRTRGPWFAGNKSAFNEAASAEGVSLWQNTSTSSRSQSASKAKPPQGVLESKHSTPNKLSGIADDKLDEKFAAELKRIPRLSRSEYREARVAQLQRGIEAQNKRKTELSTPNTTSTAEAEPKLISTPTKIAAAVEGWAKASSSKGSVESANEPVAQLSSAVHQVTLESPRVSKGSHISKSIEELEPLSDGRENQQTLTTGPSGENFAANKSEPLKEDSPYKGLLADAMRKVKESKERITAGQGFRPVVAQQTGPPLRESADVAHARPEGASRGFNPKTAALFKHVSEDEKAKKDLLLTSWGPKQQRDKKPAGIRRITLRNFPPTATPRHVAAFVWGGIVESIRFTAGDSFAQITFVEPADAERYYLATSNGIPWPGSKDRFIDVEKSTEKEPVSGLVAQWVKNGKTRCLRLVGVEEYWGAEALVKLAEKELNKRHPVEYINVAPNRREVLEANIRFCSIHDAVKFETIVNRMDEFEAATKSYQDDPCEIATGFHGD